MPRQRVHESGCTEQRGELIGEVGAELWRALVAFVLEFAASVDDCHEVFKIMAREKITATASVECLEFGLVAGQPA